MSQIDRYAFRNQDNWFPGWLECEKRIQNYDFAIWGDLGQYQFASTDMTILCLRLYSKWAIFGHMEVPPDVRCGYTTLGGARMGPNRDSYRMILRDFVFSPIWRNPPISGTPIFHILAAFLQNGDTWYGRIAIYRRESKISQNNPSIHCIWSPSSSPGVV